LHTNNCGKIGAITAD